MKCVKCGYIGPFNDALCIHCIAKDLKEMYEKGIQTGYLCVALKYEDYYRMREIYK